MWWLFTKKVQRHREILPGESVLHACYGLGSKLVQLANRTVSPTKSTWTVPRSTDGFAAAIDGNGVVALTNVRLCFFPKTFAFGTPKTMKAHWPLELVQSISHANHQLQIVFVDGSVAELHVPASQSPKKLVAAFVAISDNGG